MIAKVVIVLALFTVAHSAPKPGQEAPPPKVHTYNVPSVAKVAYPGPTVTKNVETYSAPSIEKTTTITRTITAPLNAPNVQSVQYSAPAAPVVAAAPAVVAAPVGFGGPGGFGGAGGFGGFGYGAQAYGGGIGGQTVYSAPSLGYNIGENYGAYGGQAYAAAPAYAAYAAPAVAYAQPAIAAYAAPAVVKGSYGAPHGGY